MFCWFGTFSCSLYSRYPFSLLLHPGISSSPLGRKEDEDAPFQRASEDVEPGEASGIPDEAWNRER